MSGAGEPDAGDGSDVMVPDAAFEDSAEKVAAVIPLLTVRAGPRDGAPWRERLKEEYKALIQYIKMNKENDNDWFVLAADEAGVRYVGGSWCAARSSHVSPLAGGRASAGTITTSSSTNST